MEKRRRVLLYGKSVILGTVGASLRRCPQLEIVSLTPPLPTARELAALEPEVIIFDIEAAHPEPAISLLEAHPGLLLIGIDPERDRMLVLPGESRRVLTIDDLIKVIEEKKTCNSTNIVP